jgi:hypothetical protein
VLGRLATGRLEAQTRESAQAHLDGCLDCLDRFIAIRDDLQALASPEEASPRLARTLESLIGGRTPSTAPGLLERVRQVLAVRVPAWTLAGAAAAMLLTWAITERLHRLPAGSPPVASSTPAERLEPAHAQLQRTVSGVVSSVRDATTNGVEAHIVDLRDAAGSSYMLFTWGRPTIQKGDMVEIDAIFTTGAQSADQPVYQGVATALRKAK